MTAPVSWGRRDHGCGKIRVQLPSPPFFEIRCDKMKNLKSKDRVDLFKYMKIKINPMAKLSMSLDTDGTPENN